MPSQVVSPPEGERGRALRRHDKRRKTAKQREPVPAGRMLTGEAAIGGRGRPIVLFARRRRRRRWSLTAAAKPLLKVVRLPLMQCKLTGIRDSPTLCHSSSACPVNLRCISTGAHADPHHGVVLSSVDGPEWDCATRPYRLASWAPNAIASNTIRPRLSPALAGKASTTSRGVWPGSVPSSSAATCLPR
jgi:hypothetical protein